MKMVAPHRTQIVATLILLLLLQPALEAKESKKVICPIGFQVTYSNIDEKPICYRLKGPEKLTDKYVGCTGNLYTSKLYNSLNLTKSELVLWTEYKSLYPGGPFIDYSYTKSTGTLLKTSFEVDNPQKGIEEELCVVMDPVTNFTATRCDDEFYRYCLVSPYVDKDAMSDEGCDKGALRFWSPKATCLMPQPATAVGGKSAVRATWFRAQELCEKKESTLLYNGWRYSNNPLLQLYGSLPVYPLGITYDPLRHSHIVNEDATTPPAEWGLDYNIGSMNGTETTYGAIRNGVWDLVNSSYLFFDVVCEKNIELKKLELIVSTDDQKKLILTVGSGNVKEKDIYCFTDSKTFYPTPVDIISDVIHNKLLTYVLKPKGDGYYWCVYTDSKQFLVSESNRALWVRETQSLQNYYAVKLAHKKEYRLENAENMKDNVWEKYLKEYIFYSTKYYEVNGGLEQAQDSNTFESTLKNFQASRPDLKPREKDISELKLKKVFLDEKTVLLHFNLDPRMKPVKPGKWSDIQILYMKPVYYCTADNHEFVESMKVKCQIHKCVGNFNDGMQVVTSMDEHCYRSTELPTSYNLSSSPAVPGVLRKTNLMRQLQMDDLGSNSSEETPTSPSSSGGDSVYTYDPPLGTTNSTTNSTASDNSTTTLAENQPSTLSDSTPNSSSDSSSESTTESTTVTFTESTTVTSTESTNVTTTDSTTVTTTDSTPVTTTVTETTTEPPTTTSESIRTETPIIITPPTIPIPTTTTSTTTTTTKEPTTSSSTSTTPAWTAPPTPPSPDQQLNQVMEELQGLLDNDQKPVLVDDIDGAFDQVDGLLAENVDLSIPGELLHLLDGIGSRLYLDGSQNATTVRPNIALLVTNADPNQPVKGLRIANRDQDTFTNDAFEILHDEFDAANLQLENSEAVVRLPESVATSSRRISFVVFRNDRAFHTRNSDEFFVNSRVLSVNVENITEFDRGETVDIHFSSTGGGPERNQSRACAFWHFLDDGQGYWSQEGCTFIRATRPGLLDTCRCDHLTHFAEILVPRAVFSEKDEQVLEILSVIGCCLSMFGLIIIGITAVLFRSWRRDFSNKIWLQLCISVLVLIICFLVIVFARFDHYGIGCMLVGVLLHYSVLASFCWMLIAAVISYRRLVLVFTRDASHKLLRASAFSWGVPCAIVGILLSVDPQSYAGRFEDKTPTGAFCYPSGLGLWLAVYAPIAVMLLANWTLFVLIVHSVFVKKGRITRHGDRNEAIRCASVSCLLVFLFGLPWIFGLFAYNIVLAYLFALTATFQGFVLFIFFVVGNKKTRDLWLNKLKIKQTRKIPVTSSTYTNNRSTAAAPAVRATPQNSVEAKVSKPRSLANSDDSRFS